MDPPKYDANLQLHAAELLDEGLIEGTRILHLWRMAEVWKWHEH
jgi:hypothetical protein